MDSQQISPNLSQLRSVPSEILQNLSGLPEESPRFPMNKSTAQSSPVNSGGDVNGSKDSHTYASGNESEHSMKTSMDRSNSPKDGRLNSKEESVDTEHPSPDPIMDTSSAGGVDRNIIDPSTLTQNPRGKPITPQSVNGNNETKDNASTSNSEALDKSTTSGGGSSVSPSSIHGKEDTHHASNEDLSETSPKNLDLENKD